MYSQPVLNVDVKEGVDGQTAQVVVAQVKLFSDGGCRSRAEQLTDDQSQAVIVQVPVQRNASMLCSLIVILFPICQSYVN